MQMIIFPYTNKFGFKRRLKLLYVTIKDDSEYSGSGIELFMKTKIILYIKLTLSSVFLTIRFLIIYRFLTNVYV